MGTVKLREGPLTALACLAPPILMRWCPMLTMQPRTLTWTQRRKCWHNISSLTLPVIISIKVVHVAKVQVWLGLPNFLICHSSLSGESHFVDEVCHPHIGAGVVISTTVIMSLPVVVVCSGVVVSVSGIGVGFSGVGVGFRGVGGGGVTGCHVVICTCSWLILKYISCLIKIN